MVVLGYLETPAVQMKRLSITQDRRSVDFVVGHKRRKKNVKTDQLLHSYCNSNSVDFDH